jgi:hypothetical protein
MNWAIQLFHSQSIRRTARVVPVVESVVQSMELFRRPLTPEFNVSRKKVTDTVEMVANWGLSMKLRKGILLRPQT